MTTVKPRVRTHALRGTLSAGSTRRSQSDAGRPWSRAKAKHCREVEAKVDTAIINIRTTSRDVMAWAPAGGRLPLSRIARKGKVYSVVAAVTSGIVNSDMSMMAKAMGMFRAKDQNMARGAIILASRTSSDM